MKVADIESLVEMPAGDDLALLGRQVVADLPGFDEAFPGRGDGSVGGGCCGSSVGRLTVCHLNNAV
jgi:hypothetical protein